MLEKQTVVVVIKQARARQKNTAVRSFQTILTVGNYENANTSKFFINSAALPVGVICCDILRGRMDMGFDPQRASAGWTGLLVRCSISHILVGYTLS